jgi:hypothetical protein
MFEDKVLERNNSPQRRRERKELLYYENTQQLCDLCAIAATLMLINETT